MLSRFVLAPLALTLSLLGSGAMAATCPPPSTLANGHTADANDVTGVFSCIDASFAPLAGPHFTGSVGIGTATPAKTLDVNGTVGIGTTSASYLTANYNGDALAAVDSGGYYYAGGGFTDTQLPVFIGYRNNRIVFSTGTAGTGSERVRITNAGNVGIGTTAPGDKLEVESSSAGTAITNAVGMVVGNSNATTNNYSGVSFTDGNVGASASGLMGVQLTDRTNHYGDFVFATRSAGGFTEKMRILSTGNVGIGTASPSARLHVVSPSGSDAQIMLSQTGAANWSLYNPASTTRFSIYQQVSGAAEVMTFLYNGNVGIGTTAPAVTLAVVGDIRTGSSGTNGCLQNFAGTALAGTCSSDAALKIVRGSVSNVLGKLASLQLVHFNWNSKAAAVYHNSMIALNTGFIAQSVEQQFPELVSFDQRGYRQLDYTTLSLYGLEAIRELKLTADRQANAVHDQQAEIRALLAANRAQAASIRQLQTQMSALLRRNGIRTAAK